MVRNRTLPAIAKTLQRNRTMLNAVSAATGLLRHIAIKSHHSAMKQREKELREKFPSFLSVHCQVFKERGSGSTPTIVIAGFVPDATEVIEFQRKLLKSYGDIYYLNYPRNGFATEVFLAQLADLVKEINCRGEKPVLFGISFGCGLLYRFMRGNGVSGLKIGGIVMISPVLCTADLVRPESDRKGGIRIIESNLRRILKSDGGHVEDVERQVERARRCFKSLFDTGAENRHLTRRHLAIRGKIMDVIGKTSCQGGYERVLALKELPVPDGTMPFFVGPLLVLLAEAEESMLVPGSPTLALLRNRETLRRFFPNGSVATVTSNDPADPVAHASLIFHHHRYNPLLESWYDIVAESGLVAAI